MQTEAVERVDGQVKPCLGRKSQKEGRSQSEPESEV